MKAKLVQDFLSESKTAKPKKTKHKLPKLDERGRIIKSSAPSNIKDNYDRGNKNVKVNIPKKLFTVLSSETSSSYKEDDEVTIYLVNGTVIRDEIDPDYTEGGHGYIYPNYIPENEIWIDMVQDEKDLYSSTEHEIHERIDMKYNGLDYDKAHDNALKWEEKVRHALHKGFLGEEFELDVELDKRIKEFSKVCSTIKD